MSAKVKVNLMVDSGAFNVWNRGKPELNLKDYITYVKRNRKWMFSYANMDSIPGAFGRARTQDEVEASAKKSYDNLQEMKAAGLSPIPIFHQDERFEWLERMLKDGETYIGFSSSKDLQGDSKMLWLNKVFSMVSNADGRPFIKVHGFGITRPQYLLSYPFYSIDSTTWALSAGYGKVFVPIHDNGKPNYLKVPETVLVSGIVQKNDSANRRQFQGLSEMFMQCVERYLEDEVGVTVAEVRNHTPSRRRAILYYFEKLCDHLTGIKFSDHGGDFLADVRFRLRDKVIKPLQDFRPRIMHATSLSRSDSTVLNEFGIENRLLSYFDLMDRPDKVLIDYVTTGELGTGYPRKPKKKVKNRDYSNWTEKMIKAAVVRSMEPGVTLSALALELDIHPSQLSRWRQLYHRNFETISLWKNENFLGKRRMFMIDRRWQDPRQVEEMNRAIKAAFGDSSIFGALRYG